MEKWILEKIENAIDAATTRFQNDPDIIFEFVRDRKRMLFGGIEKMKEWRLSRICMVNGCDEIAIKRSHTIQRSMSIEYIARNQHVYRPIFNQAKGRMEAELISVYDASVFPGFCEQHEKIFSSYESAKEFKVDKDVMLQIYRTICREIFITDYYVSSFDESLERYKKFRDEKLFNIIKDEIGEDFAGFPDVKPTSFEMKRGDYREALILDKRSELSKYKDELIELHNRCLNDIGKNKFQKIHIAAMEVDVGIPVAIAGKGNFGWMENTKPKNVDVIFNVLPFNGKTLVFIAGKLKFKREINGYVSVHSHPLKFISMIESMMVYGSDHWFINPDIWERINTKIQEQILNEVKKVENNIGNSFGFSIFDDLRKSVLDDMKKHRPFNNEILEKIYDTETKKIA